MKDLGQKLRHLRRVSGMTIEQAASQIGVTKGYLSKVETGQSDPSVAVLSRLAEAFGVPMASMFESGSTYELSIVRSNERLALNRPGVGYKFDSLVFKKANRQVEAFVLTYPAKTDPATYRHPGEEILFMLKGELLFRYAGAEYILKEGDCAYFDARVEHRGEAYGDKPAQALVVIIPGPSNGKHSRRTRNSPGRKISARPPR
ncbi:MAG: helix-turn-helix domain-containing protein [Gammaproteobacteria bacterium]|nr:helix-turn-helix domain-containing protein [Gammaproteobacteria bacterium]GIK99952.1 MAG: XRE family transcriptional regulator [Alphaproteobacteria bacterium]